VTLLILHKGVENTGSLTFLDILATRTLVGPLQATVLRKPTNTGQHLPFSSHHPLQQDLSIPQTLFCRAENISQKDDLRKKD